MLSAAMILHSKKTRTESFRRKWWTRASIKLDILKCSIDQIKVGAAEDDLALIVYMRIHLYPRINFPRRFNY